eukprot:4960645-Lingulodinium_polyedra.AAC.1
MPRAAVHPSPLPLARCESAGAGNQFSGPGWPRRNRRRPRHPLGRASVPAAVPRSPLASEKGLQPWL